MKKSQSHINKKIVVFLIAAVLLIPVIHGLVRYGMYQTDQKADPVTDFSSYQKWGASGWVYEKPFAIFPKLSVLLQAQKSEYLFKHVRSPLPLLYDDDAVLYLACDLSADAFYSECERLKQLCGEEKSGYGQYPAYVYAVRGGRFFFEYALINEDLNRIIYISFQNKSFASEYIDSTNLPS